MAELAELKMSAAAFSRQVQVPTNRVTQILRGQRRITADTALRVGSYLGTGLELWLNLQRSYDPVRDHAAPAAKLTGAEPAYPAAASR